MSSELLLNFEKSTTKSTSLNNNPTKTLDSSKKSEGISLFDSLMNEAKKENISNNKSTDGSKITDSTSEKKTLNSDSQKLNIVSSEKQNMEQSLSENHKNNSISNLKLNVDNQIEDNLSKSQIVESDKNTNTENNSNKNISASNPILTTSTEKSVQKLVDKLVDIVVTAAKEVLKNNSNESIKPKELTNTVEKIVESKLTSIIEKDNLQNVVDKKLEIIKNSINRIKTETSIINNNQSIGDDQESIIKSEATLIKDSIGKLQKELLVNENNVNSDLKKEVLGTSKELVEIEAKDVKNISDDNVKDKIPDQIKENLSLINDNTEDIEKLLMQDKTVIKNDNSNELLKNTVIKVDYKLSEIEEAVVAIKEKVPEAIIVNTLKKENIQSISKIVENTDEIDENLKKPLLAAMFLTAQKVSKDKNNLEQVKDARNNIIEKKSLESVKDSAEKLNLKVMDTEVSYEEEVGSKPISKEKSSQLNVNNLFDNRSLNKAIITQKIEAESIIQEDSILTSKDVDNSKKTTTQKSLDTVEIAVSKEAIPILQSKIIGAKQKISGFMNDIARNMYLNYKPPVTSFRVNLNPANLGSISIVMKANKVDNSLSVSMNLSNSNTMEAMTENKVALQTAIQRQFNDNSNVSINFNMQDNTEQNEFNQSNNSDNKKQKDNQETDVESDLEEEQETIVNNDYM